MPELFEANKSRDQRFNEIRPQVVEPYISPSANIPIAPALRKPKNTKMHIFTSYSELPEKVTFETQGEDEKILLFIRRSFITNIAWILASIFFLSIPVIIFNFYPKIFSFLPTSYILILLLFYIIIVASNLFINFITWYFNIVLVTDLRIVDVEFGEIIYKNISETKLSLVQDISETQTGVTQTIFNYGDVLIQTAGTVDNFDIKSVPRPQRIVDVVDDLIGKGRLSV